MLLPGKGRSPALIELFGSVLMALGGPQMTRMTQLWMMDVLVAACEARVYDAEAFERLL